MSTQAHPHKRHQKQNTNNEHDIYKLDLIQKEVEKRMVNPQQSNYCNCSICLVNYQLKERGKAFLRQTSSSMKIESYKMQEFLQLICAVNVKIYMKLDIPEVCFFYKGEPKKLFKSNNSGVHQVQLTPNVRKNLANIFLENKRVISSNVNKNQDSASSFEMGQRDAHIKNFNSVVPSYKCGQHVEAKKVKNFIFHNSPGYAQDANFSYGRSQSEEVCILKSRDKGFQLINQKQLRQTLKSLLYLQNVDFIQTYIKPNDKEDLIFEANFDYLKGPQNNLMYNRSLTQVKTQINLINKFSKDYVPMQTLQDYQNILKDIPQEYCLYQTYKMIHYMQLTKDVMIQKLGTFWLKNQGGQISFFGLVTFQWRQNQKLSVDVGQIQELKQIMSSELTDFEHELLMAWEHMKNRKIKTTDKIPVDQQKQQQFERIKQDSIIRIAKQKQQSSMKKTRKKSTAQKSFDKSNLSHDNQKH